MPIEKIDNESTYIVKELGHVKPDLTIGGSEPTKFVPNVNKSFKLQSYDKNEFFFINVNRSSVSVLSEKESFDEDKEEISLRVGNETDVIGINGTMWEWQVVLYSKPIANKIEFIITHSPGVEFHYQDTLENEWKKNNEGFKELEEFLASASRPDDVVGSYAVYCNMQSVLVRGGQIIHAAKSGKLTHIYRPIAIDDKGSWVWCDLNITDAVDNARIMTITIPQPFLDSAVYPVKI